MRTERQNFLEVINAVAVELGKISTTLIKMRIELDPAFNRIIPRAFGRNEVKKQLYLEKLRNGEPVNKTHYAKEIGVSRSTLVNWKNEELRSEELKKEYDL